jgi:hypothetical protein
MVQMSIEDDRLDVVPETLSALYLRECSELSQFGRGRILEVKVSDDLPVPFPPTFGHWIRRHHPPLTLPPPEAHFIFSP